MTVEEMFSYIFTNIGWINLILTIGFTANAVAVYLMFKKLNEQKVVIDKLNSKLVRKL